MARDIVLGVLSGVVVGAIAGLFFPDLADIDRRDKSTALKAMGSCLGLPAVVAPILARLSTTVQYYFALGFFVVLAVRVFWVAWQKIRQPKSSGPSPGNSHRK